MKKLLLAFAFAIPFMAQSQKIRIKVEGEKDTTVFLVKYYGNKTLYADTAEMVKGVVTFDGSKQKAGMMGLLLSGQRFFEFIYNNAEIDFETKGPDFVANMKVKKSDENQLFLDYINTLKTNREKSMAIMDKTKSLDNNSNEYKDLMKQIDAINEDVKTYQHKFAKDNNSKLVGKIVALTTDVHIPEPPKNAKGEIIDSNFRYFYYRDHFFDNIDLKDDRLVNTAMFHQKIDYFFGDKFLLQHPDTIAFYAMKVLDQMDYRSEMFKYTLTQIMINVEQSKIMGMDKAFILLGDRYYCQIAPDGKAYVDWIKEEKMKDICDKVKVGKNLTVGTKAINIILPDSTEKVWKDFHSMKADYVIIYFWEASCGHCKKATPMLNKLYTEKLKARNVEVFAVSKAIGDEFKLWKKFSAEHKLAFTNVALTDSIYKAAVKDASKFIPKYTTLESLNFSETYDVYSTPTIYVVDKDKKIIAKRLGLDQLEDYLDRLQGVPNAPKIVPHDYENPKKDKEE
ncbi:MAG TPA: redoxin domain-containing protein [Crocinitomicaceae bacterium]|nr:redoxin domain-containing protein [Crocinitomicaceae bacterium]